MRRHPREGIRNSVKSPEWGKRKSSQQRPSKPPDPRASIPSKNAHRPPSNRTPSMVPESCGRSEPYDPVSPEPPYHPPDFAMTRPEELVRIESSLSLHLSKIEELSVDDQSERLKYFYCVLMEHNPGWYNITCCWLLRKFYDPLPPR